MRDDQPDEDAEKHTVPTVPPPAGETDIYEAKTQIGGLTPEALAMLRQLRDEKPLTGLDLEANVPVFEDDDAAPKAAVVRPAAGAPAPGSGDGRPPPSTGNPSAPASNASPRTAPARRPADDPPPPLFTAPRAAPSATAPAPVVTAKLGEPVETYESVFAPLPPSTASPDVGPATQPGRRRAADTGGAWQIWAIAGAVGLLFLAAAVVLMAKAGLLPGLRLQQ